MGEETKPTVDFGMPPGDRSKVPAWVWLVHIPVRYRPRDDHSIDRHYGQLFGQAQLVRHPVFLRPSWEVLESPMRNTAMSIRKNNIWQIWEVFLGLQVMAMVMRVVG